MRRRILLSHWCSPCWLRRLPAVPAGARVSDADLRRAAGDLGRARPQPARPERAGGGAGRSGAAAAASSAWSTRWPPPRCASPPPAGRPRPGPGAVRGGRRPGAGERRHRNGSGGAARLRRRRRRTGPEVVNALAARPPTGSACGAPCGRGPWSRPSWPGASRTWPRGGRALAEAEAEYARVRSAWEAQEADGGGCRRGGRRGSGPTTTTTAATTTAPPRPAATTHNHHHRRGPYHDHHSARAGGGGPSPRRWSAGGPWSRCTSRPRWWTRPCP